MLGVRLSHLQFEDEEESKHKTQKSLTEYIRPAFGRNRSGEIIELDSDDELEETEKNNTTGPADIPARNEDCNNDPSTSFYAGYFISYFFLYPFWYRRDRSSSS